jgi:plasmid maintenance system antidote protein VapI
MTPSERLRQSIRECKKSANQIARETGISQPTITTFLNGRDLRMETADKLAAYFGLELREAGEKPTKPRGKQAKRK